MRKIVLCSSSRRHDSGLRRVVLCTALLFAVASAAALADVEADKSAIRQTVLDYIEGWYSGDPDRMEQALHPDLAKRNVVAEETGDQLRPLSALALVQATRSGWGSRTPEDQREKDIEILDVDGNMASVKLIARDWIDYMHLTRWNGRWVIVNVLWSDKPAVRQPAGR